MIWVSANNLGHTEPDPSTSAEPVYRLTDSSERLWGGKGLSHAVGDNAGLLLF